MKNFGTARESGVTLLDIFDWCPAQKLLVVLQDVKVARFSKPFWLVLRDFALCFGQDLCFADSRLEAQLRKTKNQLEVLGGQGDGSGQLREKASELH